MSRILEQRMGWGRGVFKGALLGAGLVFGLIQAGEASAEGSRDEYYHLFRSKGAVSSPTPHYHGRQTVTYDGSERPGTIIINTRRRTLELVLNEGRALRYGVGVGRDGFQWSGVATVGRKAVWPAWTPPPQMIVREREENNRQIPNHMAGGIENPLGARALYLFKGGRDTMFRIHGTNAPATIGLAVSSGCIRMLNEDVIDLHNRVGVGTRVIVL